MSGQISSEQRRQLVAAKLASLVRSHFGTELQADGSLGVAGGFVASEPDASHPDASHPDASHPGASGRHGVFYAADTRMAGPALTWALRSQLSRLTVIADPHLAPDLARRTSGLVGLDVEVMAVNGVELVPAEANGVEAPPELDQRMWELAGVLSDAGARPVDDHGRIVGEVAGLEVARIDPPDVDGVRIEVGVGGADRELHSLVHTQMDSDTAVRRAVALVGAERRRGSMHPLARMARERWLRSWLIDEPMRVGLIALTPVAPLVARSTVLGNVPSAAVGQRADGVTVVVVCSTGIDLDVVPEAADYRRREAPDAELVIVVPTRDHHAITEALAAATPRCEVIGMTPPW